MITINQLNKFEELLSQHQQLYPSLPVKAEQFESLFAQITSADWSPNNHNVGEDMVTNIVGMKKPSLKSGVIKDGYLNISSHRTSKFKTLREKIDFLKTREYDSYVCLSRPDKNKAHKYKLIYFEKNIIDYDSLSWVDTYNKNGIHSGWCGESKDKKIKVNIIKSMSHQVWVSLSIDKIKVLREYEITK